MDYMYDFGISAHTFLVYGILLVILINFLVTYTAKELAALRRFMTIFTPMGSVMLAGAIFTGIVLMAAKHLDFTIQNIVMITASVVLIVLEVVRSKALRRTTKEHFSNYRLTAYKVLIAEALLVLATVGFVHATMGHAG